MDFLKDSLERRRQYIKSHPSFKEAKLKTEDITIFISNLSDLIWWNGNFSFLIYKDRLFSMQTELLESTHSTLRSIWQIIELGHFSDVNVLLRKVRDDLFLFLYLLECVSRHKIDSETKQERNAIKWQENRLENLHLSVILTYLMENDQINKVVSEYKLQETWDKIGGNLNKYVHGNGKCYIQLNYVNLDSIIVDKILNEITFKLSYIVSIFVVLLILIKPNIISSRDYIDALELGLQPVEGSQYNIAPFIKEFIDTQVIKLHPDIKIFLKESVYMKFE